jgi:hypothetical protein
MCIDECWQTPSLPKPPKVPGAPPGTCTHPIWFLPRIHPAHCVRQRTSGRYGLVSIHQFEHFKNGWLSRLRDAIQQDKLILKS